MSDGDEPEDRTHVVRDLFDRIPFHRANGIEVLAVTPRRAETKLPFDDSLVGDPERQVIHGGVVSAMVDLTGAAVFAGECRTYTPTIDLRVNYLTAAREHPLYGTATVARGGRSIGVAHVEIESDDTVCATGTGVYKLADDE